MRFLPAVRRGNQVGAGNGSGSNAVARPINQERGTKTIAECRCARIPAGGDAVAELEKAHIRGVNRALNAPSGRGEPGRTSRITEDE